MAEDYQPISCSFHDELELRAMKRKLCEVEYRDENGDERVVHATIVDVYAQNGEEFLRLDSDRTIRLDHLVSVDGVRLRDFC